MAARRHKAQGWYIRRKTANGVWHVRFTLPDGRERELSTGQRDHRAAAREAAKIYARELDRFSREPRPVLRAGSRAGRRDLLVAAGQWLAAIENTHAETTRATWEGYVSSYWLEHFGHTITADMFTRETCDAYIRTRLGKVLAATVRKERTALCSFLDWLFPPSKEGADDGGASMVPRLPKKARGTPSKRRTRVTAPAISRELVQRWIRELPEWSRPASRAHAHARFPVRARFLVMYETSLRVSTFDRLSAPEHYQIGHDRITLTDDADKMRWGRDVPLTKRARRVLDHVVRALAQANGGEPYTGLIFGEHDYADFLREAAERALPKEIRDRLQGTHLRSAAITHWLEENVPMPSAQYMAGHTLISTTARYVKPSFASAAEAMKKRGR